MRKPIRDTTRTGFISSERGAGVDFSPDENQRAVAELAREVLRREMPDAVSDLDPALGYDPAVWAALAKAGLTALAVPAELGGDGLGIDAVAVVLTEVGARGARVPALATLALGVLPLAVHGTAEQQSELLPAVAAGTALLTAAVSEPGRP
ncbi:MAG: acyl-CoA dehydrogenase family protein, partial [Mycobacteriaceae bacterium]|nr:acyl-CoA dehydrogenase family protein [Mycobacteriaceae bacterium]